MPSISKKQQIAMRIALAAKKGKVNVSKLKGASLQMYKGMSEKELNDFAMGPVKKPKMAAR
jgi:hypothetical protein